MILKQTLLLWVSTVFVGTAVLSCYSCSPQAKPEVEPGQGNEEEQKEGAYKFIASPLQGTWKTGDQIYVHGSIGSWHEVVTLKAEDISSDGKTATADLGEVKEKPASPDGLYAGWPDSSVKHLKTKIGSKTTFESYSGLITAAYLQGDTFEFIDISSVLSFTVNGDFNQYALCANDRTGLNVTGLEVDYTSEKTSMTRIDDGYPFIYGSLESGKEVRIWMPGDMTLKGLTLYLGKNDKWSASYSVSSDVKLEAGKATELGAISAVPYSGLAPKMPQMLERTKFTGLKIEELSGLCLSKDRDFIWGVGDQGQIAKISFGGELLGCVKLRTTDGKQEWSVDAEGVTLNEDTGDILISGEPNYLMRIPAADIPVLFDNEKYYGIETILKVSKASDYGNSGTEGVTYYKDGIVILGAQSNSHLFFYDLAGNNLIWETKMWNSDFVAEIAGLYYDNLTDWLWIIDSEPKKGSSVMKFYAYQVVKNSDTEYSLNLLGAYPITGAVNPESICVDHVNSCVWIGDDLGDSTSNLYKYSFSGLDDFNLDH